MSNLNNKQFRLFHGTPHEIKDGYIDPTKQEGEEWEGAGPEAAFASDRPDIAAEYGHRVYEVHPERYAEHYADNVWGSDSGFAVKRELKPEVIERYKRVVTPLHEAAEEKRQKEFRANSESWQSWPGPAGGHVKYDQNGEATKTTLRPGQNRPGDPAPIRDNYYHQNHEKGTISHLKWNEKKTDWDVHGNLTPEQFQKTKIGPNDYVHFGMDDFVKKFSKK